MANGKTLSTARAGRALVLAVTLIAVTLILPAGLWAEETKVTNVFDSEDVIGVLRSISAQTGINILAEPAVQGWVTLELVDVPLEQALDMIVAPLGYTWVRVGDYYIVGSPDAKNPAFPLFTRTEVVNLKYVKADAAAKLLSDFFAPNVKVNPASNMIAITGTQAVIDRVKADLAKMDKPSAQVVMEALVVEVTADAGNSLKSDWRYEGSGGEGDSTLPASGFVDFVSGIWSGKLNVAGGLSHVLGALKCLVDSGKAEINATPKLMAMDGETAEIFLGREKYITVSTSVSETSTTTRLESIKTGISLKFTPRITESGEIILKIEPEVSDAVEVTNGLPVVNRRKVSTTVMIRDGETLVIGGLKLKSEYESKSKFPILGDLPVLGLLFGNSKKASVETETVIFITPTIVYQGK
ncbi:MAG: secretin N-terminal domain-containing protein [Clostridia bacterium]|nr:secretin N-terminal domain-containing protein [Clostridia bacterium]